SGLSPAERITQLYGGAPIRRYYKEPYDAIGAYALNQSSFAAGVKHALTRTSYLQCIQPRLQSFSMRYRVIVILLTAVALCVSATGQTKPAARKAPAANSSTWKLVSLSVKGSQRYTAEEILASCGLQIGQPANEEDFKKATEQLGQTGLFSNASYSYTYSSEGVKLELQLTDNDQLVPANFDNFVWLTDHELLEQLRGRVPLFKGLLPTDGDMADEVSNALQAVLIEHKVQGKADYIRQGPGDGGVSGFLYTIGAHNVVIQNIAFTGAGQDELPLLQNAAKRLSGAEYAHSTIRNEDRLGFLPVYLQRGHLKASFEESQVKIVREADDQTVVDVTIVVTPGLQYKFTDMTWMGNSAFTSPQLQGLVQLKSGQPADAVLLDKDLREIAKLYGTRGYMAPKITPKPVMDDSASTVHYDIEVREGDIYKMGELELRGIDEKTKKKLVFDWKLEEGQVYDSGYVVRFMSESRRDLPTDTKWDITVHEALNDDKTVDVTLTYEAKNPQTK
ncbi:MAG TPA: POTRA domain-containing protein, partial [Terriglobales bacterium]